MKTLLPDPLRSEINQAAHLLALQQFNMFRRRLLTDAAAMLKAGNTVEEVSAWVSSLEPGSLQ